jgi:hypothetical protein
MPELTASTREPRGASASATPPSTRPSGRAGLPAIRTAMWDIDKTAAA